MSLRSQQAGRDAADFDTDRHDPRFAQYRSPVSGFCPVNEADKIEAVAEALASIEQAFGKRQATVVKASLFMTGVAA